MGVIAEAVRHMLVAGMDHDKVIEAIAAMETASAPVRTARQERNARYYAKKASEKRLNASCSDVSDGQDAPSPKQRVSPTPPSETQPSTIPPSPPKGGSSPTPAEPGDVEVMAEIYNAAAAEAGWPKVQRMTAQRRSQARRRLAECGGVEGWSAAMARARGSPFLTGDNDRGWRPDFDFFLQAKSFTKLMEGAYDRRDSTPGAPSRSARGPSGASQRIAAMADEIAERRERRFPAEDPGGIRHHGEPASDSGGDVLPFGGPFASGIR